MTLFLHHKTLEWLDEGLIQGRITRREFEVGYFCARKVHQDTMVVQSYSAAQVCRFYNEDANEANRQAYRRALNGLETATRGAVRDDYRHCREGNQRTFNVFLPWENPWKVESLSAAPMSHTTVARNVAQASSATSEETEIYKRNAIHVSHGMSHTNRGVLSITNQEQQNPERERPLPPEGVPPLVPLKGGGSDAAGLESQNQHQRRGQRKPLNSKQSELLRNAANQYAALTNWIYGFTPDRDDTEKLLRDFDPEDLFCAQIRNFPIGTRVSNRTMANFFGSGARTLIEAAQANGTSRMLPEFVSNERSLTYAKSDDSMVSLLTKAWDIKFSQHWKIVRDAWDAVFGEKLEPVEAPS